MRCGVLHGSAKLKNSARMEQSCHPPLAAAERVALPSKLVPLSLPHQRPQVFHEKAVALDFARIRFKRHSKVVGSPVSFHDVFPGGAGLLPSDPKVRGNQRWRGIRLARLADLDDSPVL